MQNYADYAMLCCAQTANVNNMVLKAGQGNEVVRSKPSEDDVFNTVWIVDSNVSCAAVACPDVVDE